MRDNIVALRNMRKLNTKISALQAGGGELLRPPSPPPDPRRLRASVKPIQRGHIPLEGGKEVAKRRVSNIATTVLEHAGFEGLLAIFEFIKMNVTDWDIGASKNAMDVLTDVAADFMMNLGQTLRFYTDKYGKSMSAEVSSAFFPASSPKSPSYVFPEGNHPSYAVREWDDGDAGARAVYQGRRRTIRIQDTRHREEVCPDAPRAHRDEYHRRRGAVRRWR